MSNITITNGLPADSPWTLANSDVAKLDEANLINLAVGQLALLGASQGQTLQVQTGVLKELIGGVDTVNKQLDFLSTTNAWAGIPQDLGFPAASIGWTVPSSSTLLLADLSLIDQMISAKKLMDSLNITYSTTTSFGSFGAKSAIVYKLNLDGITKDAVSLDFMTGVVFGDTSIPFPLSNINLNTMFNNSTINQGQIFFLSDNSGSLNWYVYNAGSVRKLTAAPNLLPSNSFVIPQSEAQLQSWQIQAPNNTGISSVQAAIKSSASLSSAVEIAVNTLPQTAPPTKPPPSNAITMKIDDFNGYDMAQYSQQNGGNFYALYPPQKISEFSPDLEIPANIGKIFQGGSLTRVITVNRSGKIYQINCSVLQKFFFKPSSDQIVSWKGQYAEKIIVITQRSSDQQLFVTNLAQKYQYAFDAATYVLKAFTAMLSSAANNV